jgi:hypothetical protein
LRALYINNRAVDILPETVIAITYQTNELSELENRQANYTNTFSIPATNDNRIALGFSDTVQTESFLPYNKLRCDYFQNGIQIIANGVAIIEAFDGLNFNITVYSGIFFFFDFIGEKDLSYIDWSDLNHDYLPEAICIENENYINGDSNVNFPQMHWGAPYLYDSGTSVPFIDIRYLQPCIRFSYVIERIFNFLGYSYEGEIFDEDVYKKIALTVNTKEYYEDETGLENRGFKLALNASRTLSFGQYHPNGTNIMEVNLLNAFSNSSFTNDLFPCAEGLINYDNIHGDVIASKGWYGWLDWYNINRNTTSYVSNFRGQVDIDIRMRLRNGFVGDWSDVDYQGTPYYENVILIKINGNISQVIPITDGTDSVDINGVRIQKDYNFITQASINVRVGDSVEVLALMMSGMTDGANGFKSVVIEHLVLPTGFDFTKSVITFTASNVLQVGSPVNYNSVMPKYKFKDILRSLCNLFGLTLTENGGMVSFKSFRDIANNTPEDWSLKLDLSKDVTINYRLGDYAQNSDLKYLPNDFTNGFGDGSIIIADNTLPVRRTVLENIFSSALSMRSRLYWYVSKFLINREEFDSYPVFTPGNTYNLNDLVTKDGIIWRFNTTTRVVNTWYQPWFVVWIGNQVFTEYVGCELPRYTKYEAEPFDSGVEYSIGDEVAYLGTVYVYNNNTPSTGNNPPNATYWSVRPFQYENTIEHPSALVLIDRIGGLYRYGEVGTTKTTFSYTMRNEVAPQTYTVDSDLCTIATFDSYQFSLKYDWLIENYYSEFERALNKLKFVTVYMKISESDITSLDFTKTKYINYFGNRFYLNKIEDYIDGQTPVKCELIKI